MRRTYKNDIFPEEQPWNTVDLEKFRSNPESSATRLFMDSHQRSNFYSRILDEKTKALHALSDAAPVEQRETLQLEIKETEALYTNCTRQWISLLSASQQAEVKALHAEVKRTMPHPPATANILLGGALLHAPVRVPHREINRPLALCSKPFIITFREGLPHPVSVKVQAESLLARWFKGLDYAARLARQLPGLEEIIVPDSTGGRSGRAQQAESSSPEIRPEEHDDTQQGAASNCCACWPAKTASARGARATQGPQTSSCAQDPDLTTPLLS